MKSFLDDFVETAEGVDGFEISRTPKPTIVYNGVNVIQISRCFSDDNKQMFAEKLDCPCRPPKDKRRLQEIFAYLFTLENGERFELEKEKKEVKSYNQDRARYLEC
jgi:hypothetical protein